MLDFHDAENTDGITDVTNAKYCLKWNITEFVLFWMNKSKVGLYNESNCYMAKKTAIEILSLHVLCFSM